MTVQTRFEVFHIAHPEVYDQLVDLARTRIRVRGTRRVGMKQLFEVLRWNRMIAGLPDDGEQFKLNNNYTSRYARLIMEQEPDLAGVFETRAIKA